MFKKTLLGFLTLLALSIFSSTCSAQEPVKGNNSAQPSPAAERAQKLLRKAVAHYAESGDRSLASFSRIGEFIDGEHYVYVLDLKGIMLASGGSSSSLVGRDVSKMVDATGKPFFQEMIAGAQSSGAGQIEYRWLNRVDNKVEPKITYYQRVQDRILAVGFYIPRASAEQARKLLDDATKAVSDDPEKAFSAFNDLGGSFIQDDLYVFVIGLGDTRFRAHGSMPRLIGSNGWELRDPNGKAIIQEMISIVKSKREGQLKYVWKNPVTNKIEPKNAYIKKVGDYLVGVGYYAP